MTMINNRFHIRLAKPDDVPLILRFIRDLAEFEGLSHAVAATEESLRESLFGPNPSAEVALGCSRRRCGGVCGLLPHLLDVSGAARHVFGGHLRDAGASPEGVRHNAAQACGRDCCGAWVRPVRMVGAGLESERCPILRGTGGGSAKRMADLPDGRRGVA